MRLGRNTAILIIAILVVGLGVGSKVARVMGVDIAVAIRVVAIGTGAVGWDSLCHCNVDWTLG